MADLLVATLFWLQWGLWILVGLCVLCAFGAAALWCWATSVSFDEGDEE